MATQAITITELTYTQVVSNTSNPFLLMNVADTNINVVLRASGATGDVDDATSRAAIQLYPGYALDRNTVGEGEVWVKASEPETIISLTGG